MRNSISLSVAAAAALTLIPQSASRADSFLSRLPSPPQVSASTVPQNGDENPYGVAFVPRGLSENKLHPGDVLVANFNNSMNQQGTGTTIVSISRDGKQSTFFSGPTGLGLDTALGVFHTGYVIVGNVPSTDGTSATVKQGSLIVLNSNGRVAETFKNPILLDGPWDLALVDFGNFAQVFVSNVLNGTVSRLDFFTPFGRPPILIGETMVANGYMHRGDPNAFELGPTGLVYDFFTDTLYVASTADNAIYAISNASFRNHPATLGTLVYQDNAHLRGPLGLVIAPNGDLIAANGDAINGDPNFPSELVEFTKTGDFVDQMSVDSSGQGGAFGIAIEEHRDGDGFKVRFAAVDDVTNMLDVWNLKTP